MRAGTLVLTLLLGACDAYAHRLPAPTVCPQPRNAHRLPAPTERPQPRMTASAQRSPHLPPQPLLLTTAFLQSSCFGVISAALPAALMRQAGAASNIAAATTLGKLTSAASAAELCLSGTFGQLSDAFGRKPLMLLAPMVCALARLVVVAYPVVPVLIGVRFVTNLMVPVFWLSYNAAIADVLADDTTALAEVSSRVQAAMGLGYSLSTLLGGWLAAIDVRLAYAASSCLGLLVACFVYFGLPETLAPSRRKPLALKRVDPLIFVGLFRRGALGRSFSLIFVLQAAVNGMGDLWQVLARELRGWGASTCGSFGAVAGMATMLGTLATGPGMRRLGPRGFTVFSSAASAAASITMGATTTTPAAFASIAPMALGAGKAQPINARLTNLAEMQGIPQGQLAAERSTLTAVVRVLSPSLYAGLFAFGARRGCVALPFFLSSGLLLLSAAAALSIPADEWGQQRKPQGDAPAGGPAPGPPQGKPP
jgi:DHA1 family tetracycline resistance protein-like MFS transporter